MTSFQGQHVKSPLQMVGFYLAWVESALGASLWAVRDMNSWPRTFLIVTLSVIAFLFAVAILFTLVFLVVRRPNLIFNPSDYHPTVQAKLFDSTAELTVSNPPKSIEPPVQQPTIETNIGKLK